MCYYNNDHQLIVTTHQQASPLSKVFILQMTTDDEFGERTQVVMIINIKNSY